MKKGKPSEQGFVTLSAVMLLIFISGLMIASAVARTVFLARCTHQTLVEEQAARLAESAAQRALNDLAQGTISEATAEEKFTYNISPVFIGDDPVIPEEIEMASKRVILVNYGYTVTSASTELSQALGVDPQNSYFLTAYADFPYRETTLRRELHRVAIKTSEGRWNAIVVSGK